MLNSPWALPRVDLLGVGVENKTKNFICQNGSWGRLEPKLLDQNFKNPGSRLRNACVATTFPVKKCIFLNQENTGEFSLSINILQNVNIIA